jgi:hypothetical protein
MRYICRRIVQEVWHALVYFFVLLALCLSWFIGITRFWDNVSTLGAALWLAVVCVHAAVVRSVVLHSIAHAQLLLMLLTHDPAYALGQQLVSICVCAGAQRG